MILRFKENKHVLDMILNNLMVQLYSWNFRECELPFYCHYSQLQSGGICSDPIYGPIEILVYNTWNYLTVCNQMSSGLFLESFLQIIHSQICVYKQYLALNNLHKQHNQPSNFIPQPNLSYPDLSFKCFLELKQAVCKKPWDCFRRLWVGFHSETASHLPLPFESYHGNRTSYKES